MISLLETGTVLNVLAKRSFEVHMYYFSFNRNKEKEKNKILSLPKKWLKMMMISLESKVFFVVSHCL